MKKSTLAQGLRAAAGKPMPVEEAPPRAAKPAKEETVLIGAHYPLAVRSALLLVQAEPVNARKNLKDLLGEAINDLCAKYGKPQPYSAE